MKHFASRTIFLFLTFIFSSAVLATENTTDKNTQTTDVRANDDAPINLLPLDTNKYRVLSLENGMEVVLIEASSAAASSVSIGLGIGFWNDPEGQSGIAHFLEHMVFLKSEKYPEIDGLFNFIQSKGGWINAFTGATHTVYNFQSPNMALKESLDRLVSGIQSPLLDVAYVEKEINAVDSEWRLKKDDDRYAAMLAIREVFNPKHPASKFGSGNKETLSASSPKTLLKNLKAFHNAYYSASITRASIYSSLSLDEQEKIAVSILEKIDNRPVQIENINEPTYIKKQLNKRIYLKSTTSEGFVSYIFPFKERKETIEDRPNYVVAKLLGSMHNGGLIDGLRQQGLIHEMRVNVSKPLQSQQGSVEITIHYTEVGRSHESDVLKAIFEYSKQAKKEYLSETYIEFLREKLNVEFNDASPHKDVWLTNFFVTRNPDIDIRNSFDMAYKIKGFNKKAIKRRLSAIQPTNVLIVDQSPDNIVTDSIAFSSQKKRVEKANLKAVLKGARLKLDFTAPPIFNVSTQIDEHHQFLEAPELVVDAPGIQARLMHSKKFQNEKGVVRVMLRSSFTSKHVDEFVHSHLLHNLLHKQNRAIAQKNQESYGVGFHDKNNIFAESSISIYGPTTHHVTVLDELLATYNRVDITEEKIKIEVDPYVEAMKGMSKAEPLDQAFMKRQEILGQYPNKFSAQARIDALNTITVESLTKFRDDYLKKAFIDIYAFGNYTEDTVKEMCVLAQKHLGARNGKFVRLTKSKEYNFSKKQYQDVTFDVNATGVGYALAFVAPEKSLSTVYQANILATLMHSQFFESLRTEQKLAYKLGVYNGAYDGHASITLFIHSNVAGFGVLDESFNAYLGDFGGYLDSVKDSDINSIKQSLKEHLLKEPENVYEESSEYFSEWSLRPDQYFSKAARKKAIDAVTAKDLIALFKRLIEEEQSERFRFQVRGKDFSESAFVK